MRIFKYILIAISFLIYNVLIGQTHSAVPGVTTAEYSNLESLVNHNNGIVSTSYPIYSINEFDLSLSISLSNQLRGIKVTDVASEIGLGWSLNTGGGIYRSVKGFPDDINGSNYGNIHGYLFTNGNEAHCNSGCPTECIADLEPDIFYYNVEGQSGKFIIAANGTSLIHLDKSDIEISFTQTPFGLIESWTLITTSGTQYIYSDYETVKAIKNPLPAINPLTHAQNWKLSKIISRNGHEINLNYKTQFYEEYQLHNYTKQIWARSSVFGGNHSLSFDARDSLHVYEFSSQMIESIESAYSKIVFEHSSREDVLGITGKPNLEKIDGIEILTKKDNTWNCFKKFSLYQDYFISSSDGLSTASNPNNFLPPGSDYPDLKRLKLKSITELSCQENLSLETKFFYHEEHPLPRRLSHSQDYWGYHNGDYSNWFLFPEIQFRNECLPSIEIDWSSLNTNRNSHEDFMKQGTLYKVEYPNGYFEEFVLESNEVLTHQLKNDGVIHEGTISLCSLTGLPNSIEISTVEFKSNHDYKLELDIYGESNPLCVTSLEKNVEIYIRENGSNSNWNLVYVSDDYNDLILDKKDILLQFGMQEDILYDFKVEFQQPVTIDHQKSAKFEITKFSPISEVQNVGGLRIKEIINNELSRNFDYNKTVETEYSDYSYKDNLYLCNPCDPNSSFCENSEQLEFYRFIPCDAKVNATLDVDIDLCNVFDTHLRIIWSVENSSDLSGEINLILTYNNQSLNYSHIDLTQNLGLIPGFKYKFQIGVMPFGNLGPRYLKANFNLYTESPLNPYQFEPPSDYLSSGILIDYPLRIGLQDKPNAFQYWTSNCEKRTIYEFSLSSSNLLSSPNSSHIFYENVKETINSGEIGHTEYKYHIEKNAVASRYVPNYSNPFIPLSVAFPSGSEQYYPNFGTLESVISRDQNGNEVSKKYFEYIFESEKLKRKKSISRKKCDGDCYWKTYDYTLLSSYILPKKITSEVDGIISRQEFTYRNDKAHYNPITKTISNVDESIKRTWSYTYPDDDPVTYSDLVARNIVAPPMITLIDGGSGGGSKTDIVVDNSGLVIPSKSYFLDQAGNWVLNSEIITYNNEGQATEVWTRTSPHNTTSSYQDGLLKSTTYKDRTTTYNYDDIRRPTTSVNPLNHTNGITLYDGLHRVKSKISKNGLITSTFDYEINPTTDEKITETTSFSDGTPDRISETYIDELGRAIKTIRKEFGILSVDFIDNQSFDDFGRPLTTCPHEKGGCDLMEEYEASPLSRLLKMRPSGSPKSIEFSFGHNTGEVPGHTAATLSKKTVTDENQNTSSVFTDILGRKVCSIDALGQKTLYNYNDRDQLTEVITPDGTGYISTKDYKYEYNNLDLLWKKHIPGKDGPYVYTYDSYDNVSTEVMPNGHTLSMVRNPDYPSFLEEVFLNGSLIKKYYPEDLTKHNWVQKSEIAIMDDNAPTGQILTNDVTSFDAFGKVLTETQDYYNGASSQFTYTYDDLDNMLTYNNVHSKSGTSHTVDKVFTYDRGYRLLSTDATYPQLGTQRLNDFSYNLQDLVVGNNIGGLQQMTFDYNARNWLTKINSVDATFTPLAPPMECNLAEPDPCENIPDPGPRVGILISLNPEDILGLVPTNVLIEKEIQFLDSLGVTTTRDQHILPLHNGNIVEDSVYSITHYFSVDTLVNDTTAINAIVYEIEQYITNVTPSIQQEMASIVSVLQSMMLPAGGIGGGGQIPLPPTPYQGKLFGMELHYFDGNGEVDAAGQYNGNISWMEWRVRDEVTQTYGFTYDALNRLRAAKYKGIDEITCEPLPPMAYNTSYNNLDARGNIGTISRRGVTEWINDEPQYGYIDLINTQFAANSNIISSVSESSLFDVGYKSIGGTVAPAFTDGNKTSDPAQGVNTTYNFLDLPLSIVDNNGSITCVYDADGNKLRQSTVITGQSSDLIHYCGEFEYLNNDLHLIHHEEGNIIYNPTFNHFENEYHIADHLGNVRVRFADRNGNGSLEITPADPVTNEIKGSYHYYPFGLKMDGPWIDQIGDNKYQYNGIETVDGVASGIGLTTYRIHDPALANWWQIDPKAEKYASDSPFCAMLDNPINLSDPQGDEPITLSVLTAIAIGGGIINTASNWNNIGSFTEGLNYFAVGAAGYGISTVNPLAGAAVLSGGNLLTKGIYGHLSDFNSIEDFAPVATNVLLDGLSVYSLAQSVRWNSFKLSENLTRTEILQYAKEKIFPSITQLAGTGARREVIKNFGIHATSQVVKQAVRGSKAVVIGEGMEAVKAAARNLQSQGINARWYQAWSKNIPSNRLMNPKELAASKARNARWLKAKMNQGYTVYDIGIDVTRPTRSIFYEMEKSILKLKRYPTITIPR